jgi:LCP family protein required for cell wall assembly
MDNFRRRNRDDKRQPVDGILNAPTRSQGAQSSESGRMRRRIEGLRSGGRKIDDFKRSEGFHVAQTGGVRSSIEATPAETKAQSRRQQASLLHMSLPGGALGGESKKGDKRKEKRQAGHSRWRTFRKWSLRSALVLAVLVLVVGGFLVFKGILKVNKVFKGGGAAAALADDVKPELLKGEGDGRVNILLLGRGGTGHAGADLTDTIIVASIDPVNKTSTLVSIPRDLWVTVSGSGSSKINAVYANAKNKSLYSAPKEKEKAEQAGISAVQQVIGQVLGIPIHYYGMIDFEGFKQAVDIVGGVDINVPAELAVKEHLWDETTGKNYYLDVPAGMQHFDSTRALYFTRSRHTSLRGDFTRSERQRLFIQALSQKVLSAGTYTNPLKISQLLSAFGDHLSTDMSINNALRLADIGKGMDMSKVGSVGFADPPNNFVRTDNVNGQSVVRPTAGFGDYSEIQNYIRNTLKDPYLAKENARIAVLNGTPVAGLATKKADQLKSYGYNVTVIDDAPTKDYVQTVLVDVSGNKKPFTKNYLERRLELKAVTKLPDTTIQTQDVDFVIILGQSD